MLINKGHFSKFLFKIFFTQRAKEVGDTTIQFHLGGDIVKKVFLAKSWQTKFDYSDPEKLEHGFNFQACVLFGSRLIKIYEFAVNIDKDKVKNST